LHEAPAAHPRLSVPRARPSGAGGRARLLRQGGPPVTPVAHVMPKTAMVLAAGLGKRMRPLTDSLPKPLVKIAGKTLLDRGLDALAEAGVEKAVVNVHQLAGQIVKHVKTRAAPGIVISDESALLLDSAGGIVRALPALGPKPFLILNADTFWI